MSELPPWHWQAPHQPSQSYPAWAAWARKQLAEKSETAARVIAHGGQHKWLSDREIARRQVEESRAARVAFDGLSEGG